MMYILTTAVPPLSFVSSLIEQFGLEALLFVLILIKELIHCWYCCRSCNHCCCRENNIDIMSTTAVVSGDECESDRKDDDEETNHNNNGAKGRRPPFDKGRIQQGRGRGVGGVVVVEEKSHHHHRHRRCWSSSMEQQQRDDDDDRCDVRPNGVGNDDDGSVIGDSSDGDAAGLGEPPLSETLTTVVKYRGRRLPRALSEGNLMNNRPSLFDDDDDGDQSSSSSSSPETRRNPKEARIRPGSGGSTEEAAATEHQSRDNHCSTTTTTTTTTAGLRRRIRIRFPVLRTPPILKFRRRLVHTNQQQQQPPLPPYACSGGAGRWSIPLVPADHPAKILWDCLTVLLSLANAYAKHIAIRDRQFVGTTPNALFLRVCEIWFVLDIVMNFFTQHELGGAKLTDARAVWARYLTTWFAVDVLSLLPGEVLYLQPLIDRQNRRGFMEKWLARTRAVSRVVVRVVRARYVRLFGQVARQSKRSTGVGGRRLLRLIIKYVPKYCMFFRNMKAVLAIRCLRQVHWFRKLWFSLQRCSNTIHYYAMTNNHNHKNNHHNKKLLQQNHYLKEDDDATYSLTEEYDDYDDYDDDDYDDDDDDDYDGGGGGGFYVSDSDESNKQYHQNRRRRRVVQFVYENGCWESQHQHHAAAAEDDIDDDDDGSPY